MRNMKKLLLVLVAPIACALIVQGPDRQDPKRDPLQGRVYIAKTGGVVLLTGTGLCYQLNLSRSPSLSKAVRQLEGQEIRVSGKVDIVGSGAALQRIITVVDWWRVAPVTLSGGQVHGSVIVRARARSQVKNQKDGKKQKDRKTVKQRARIVVGKGLRHPRVVSLPKFIVPADPIYLPDVRLTRDIYVPDIQVWLRNVATAATSPVVQSDVRGMFYIPHMPAGTYELCWKADGYIPGCRHEKVVIANHTVYLQHVSVSARPGLLFGRVTLQDKRVARRKDSVFGVHAETLLTLTDSGGNTVASARANATGEYVLPHVASGTYRIKASCESVAVQEAIVFSGGSSVLDLTLPNSVPIIKGIYATKGGTGVRRASGGDVLRVHVQVEDPDGDVVHYKWRPNAASGGLSAFVSVDDATVEWKLAGTSSLLQSMQVLVGDNKGGYAIANVDISTRAGGVLFTGTVSENGGPRVAGADVSLNGIVTKTNSFGYFSLTVPESGRYVLNFKKRGYQLLSKILLAPAIGSKYRMRRSQKFVVDPTKPIQIVEEPRKHQKSRGAVLKIPANALVGPDGKLPPGLVHIYLSSCDLRDPYTGIPGDFGGINTTGDVRTLTSYGAVNIDVTDGSGTVYQLASGKEATLGTGIDQDQLSHSTPPPAQIALWYYDEVAGLWKEGGEAKRAGAFYETKIKHFSVINVDVAKTDAACMRLVVDTTRLALPFQVRLTIPTGSGLPKVTTRNVTQPLSAVYRLPPDQPITIEVLDSLGNPIGLATQTVDSGPIVSATGAVPVYPYTECGSEAFLSFEAPDDGGFLDFYETVRGFPSDDAVASAYYDAVYPSGVLRTLSAWKTERGFDSGDDASAVYFNDIDLGFGRSMHMKKVGSVVAYYVTNYATVDEARIDVNAGATVAMEYSPPPSGAGDSYIKFFVFQDRDGDGDPELVNDADLDARGPKFVPNLCIVCHGSTPRNLVGGVYPDEGNVRAQFIPFDLEGYQYSEFESPPFSGIKPFGRDAQEPQFKKLNEGVLQVDQANVKDAIKELVAGWYGGTVVSGSVALPLPNDIQNTAFVPSGWLLPADESLLYNTVIKTSCRICHATRDPGLDWAKFSGLGLKEFGFAVQQRVCKDRIMPQARKTYLKFWLSTAPHRPNLLHNAGLTGWDVGKTCPFN